MTTVRIRTAAAMRRCNDTDVNVMPTGAANRAVVLSLGGAVGSAGLNDVGFTLAPNTAHLARRLKSTPDPPTS
ncbi:hypothetical protein ACIRBX_22305 [Kitasatospora sp. NPDC096147]|uniref:hypothetical protein n=1 Tax=Kitasatospora sp. NPDC096147 TaxID=3364093 RepID=UPI003822CD5C